MDVRHSADLEPLGRQVHNADIAETFYRMAELLEIEGANPFRVRAYRRAAATIKDLPESVTGMLARGVDLDELPGVGEDLAGKIAEICKTGGLSAKLLAELGKTRTVGGKRFRLSTTEDFAGPLKAYLERSPGVTQVVVAGSFRRRRETVGDIDVLAICANGPATTERFTKYEEVEKVTAKGPTRATVLLEGGLQVDLRVAPEESYGAALVYFTGSKAHNIALRRMAQERGLKISEYGVFRGMQRIAGRTEEEVYASVGLPWIAPELREDRGELDAALEGRLPTLVELKDIRGDLHVHTRASDGEREDYAIDLAQVMQAAQARGCFLEINAHPSRLDLDDVHVRAAKDMGLKIAIGSDAHSDAGVSSMGYGVDQARRGWLEADDVLNTRSWREIERMLRR